MWSLPREHHCCYVQYIKSMAPQLVFYGEEGSDGGSDAAPAETVSILGWKLATIEDFLTEKLIKS